MTLLRLTNKKQKSKENYGKISRKKAAKKNTWRHKKKVKSKVYIAKSKFQEEKSSQLESNKIKNFIIKLTQKMKHENQNTAG